MLNPVFPRVLCLGLAVMATTVHADTTAATERPAAVSSKADTKSAKAATNGGADVESGRRLVREAVSVARQLRKSDNIYDQVSAAGTLVDIGDKESLQFLADTLSHSDWSVMRSAIDMLLNVQHPAGIDLIYRAAESRGRVHQIPV
jgi:HEAT repeat protein